MSGLTLSAPITGAAYTYATRYLGDEFTADQAMLNGVNGSLTNFVSVECDELRIRVACPSQGLDKFHLTGLNLTGLTYSVTAEYINQVYSQVADVRPRSSQRDTYRLQYSQASNIELVIGGINGNKLNIDQLFFGLSGWGEHCYSDVTVNPMAQYTDHDTRGYSGASRFSKKKSESLSFESMRYEDYTDLEYFADETLVDRLCLAEYAHKNDPSMVVISPSSGQYSRGNYYSFNIGIKEAFEQ